MRVRRTSWLLLTAALCGCATEKIVYTPLELRDAAASKLGPQAAARLEVPFEIGPELQQAAERLTMGVSGEDAKLHVLAQALSDPQQFGLHHDSSITGVAAETIARRAGDCLSLTSLFIGLTRSVGLNVFFLDARGVQEFAAEGNLMIDRRHIVAGSGRPPDYTVVDFDRVRTVHVLYTLLDDRQAMARFYNNRGFERLRDQANQDAIDAFTIALVFDPQFAAAHNNMGVALARVGRQDEAEQRFRQALYYDPVYSAAMINLSNLYRRAGRVHDADALVVRAGSLRLRDPLWRLQAGLEAQQQGDPRKAIDELRAAVALDPKLLEGWLALARAYDAVGERRGAVQALDHVLRLEPGRQDALELRERLSAGP